MEDARSAQIVIQVWPMHRMVVLQGISRPQLLEQGGAKCLIFLDRFNGQQTFDGKETQRRNRAQPAKEVVFTPRDSFPHPARNSSLRAEERGEPCDHAMTVP